MASLATVGIMLEARNLGAFNAAVANIRRQITFVGSASRNLNTENRKSALSMSELNRSFSSVGTAMQNFGQTIRNLGTTIRGLGNELAAIGFRLSFLLTVPISMFLGGAIRTATKFETEIVKLNTVIGISEKTVQSWARSLTDMASEVGRAPLQLAEALFFVASGGERTAEALTVVRQAAIASALGMGKVKDVAIILTAITQAYGKENLNASRATEILLALWKEGQIEISRLIPTLGRVIGVAATMGVTFEEVAAFISTFTRAGVPAEVAVTSLRGALTTLLKPTKQAEEHLASYGLTIQKVRAAIADPNIGLARTIFALMSIFGDQSDEMAIAIGNVRALAGVLFNLNATTLENNEAFKSWLLVLESIQNSSGNVATAFERVQKTTQFHLDVLSATIQAAGIALGEAFLPALNELVKAILPFVKALRDLAREHPQLILTAVAFLALAASLAPVLIISGLLISSVGTIIATFGGFIFILGQLLTPIGLVGAAMASLTALFLFSAREIAQKLGVDLEKTIHGAIPRVNRAFDIGMQNMEQTLLESGARLPGEMGIVMEDMIAIADAKMQDAQGTSKSWGYNLIVQFANGIAQGVVVVVKALISIGQVIAKFLRPRSPPLILPHIDDWGRSAMMQFFEGMGEADPGGILRGIAARIQDVIGQWNLGDFNIFSNLTDFGTGFLRSLSGLLFEEVDLVPNIFEFREGIAAIIEEFRNFGSVSDEVIGRVTSLFSSASADVQRYISLYLDLIQAQEAVKDATDKVKEAQQRLNDVTAKYRAILKPLNDELQKIEDRRQEVVDAQRIRRLQQILKDPRATALVKELALMELREIELRNQIRLIEREQDAAEEAAQVEVDSAQAALDAAKEQERLIKEQVDAQRALIDVQIEHNELLREQISLMERLNKELRGGAAAGGAGDAFAPPIDIEDFIPDMPSLVSIIGDAFENLKGPLDAFKQDLKDLKKEVLAAFAPLLGEDGLLAQLKDVWSDVFINAGRIIKDDVIPPVKRLGKALAGIAVSIVRGIVIPAFNDFAPVLEDIATQLGKMAKPIIEGLIIAFEDLAEELEKAQGPRDTLTKLLGPLGEGALALLLWKGAIKGIVQLLPIFKGLLILAGIGVLGFLATLGAPFWIVLGIALGLIALLVAKFRNKKDGAIEAFGDFTEAVLILHEKWKSINKTIEDAANRILLNFIKGMHDTAVTAKQLLFVLFNLDVLLKKAVDKLKTWGEGVLQVFKDLYRDIVGQSIIPDLVKGVQNWLIDELRNRTIGKLEEWRGNVVGLFETLSKSVINIIHNMVHGENGFVAKAQSIQDELIKILESAIKFVQDNLMGRFADLGRAIIEAITSGVVDAALGLVGAVVGAVQDAQNAGLGSAGSGPGGQSDKPERTLPGPVTPISRPAPSRGVQVNVNVGSINNGMDLQTFNANVEDAVTRAMA